MKKSNRNNNKLIKRKNLIQILKEQGITRIKPQALTAIEAIYKQSIKDLAGELKEKLIIKGKKTLEESDVKEIVLRNKTIRAF